MERCRLFERPRLTLLVRVPYAYRDGTCVITQDGDHDGISLISIIADTTAGGEMFFEIRAIGQKLPHELFSHMAQRLEFHSEVIEGIMGLRSGPHQVRTEPSPDGPRLEAEMSRHSWASPAEALGAVGVYLFVTLELQAEGILLWRIDTASVKVKSGQSVPFAVLARMMMDDRSHIDSLTLELQAIRASRPSPT